LYLDEILEFRKETLETLRGPLEDKEVTISRLWASLTYPCNFMLIASMNPCPCGYYGSSIKNCICSPTSIKRYLSKLSGPLLDRIDINVNIQPLEYQNFKENEKIETSKQIKERVEKAIKMQRERYANMDILYNSELTPKLIERYCKLDNVGNKIMEKAFINYGLTARTYTRILKVARTIADLEGNMKITAKNIAEAIQYRFVN
jgi:predicted ATPase with chaperone activity